MIENFTATAWQALATPQVPQGPTSPGALDAAHHVLAVAPAVSHSAAGSLGGAAVLLILYVWYEFKHKGWDWAPFLMGIGIASLLSGTGTGGSIVGGIGTAIGAIFGGVFSALGSVAS
jgi:hypothetical protein